MLQFRKSSRACCLAIALLTGSGVQAGIVIEYGASYGQIAPPARLRAHGMSGIVMLPAYPQTETGYHIQRSQAWRGHHRNDPRTGAMLVYPGYSGAMGAPTSSRQVDIRTNISRAHAYRQNYFK